MILAEHEEKISNKKEILEKEIEKLQAKVNFLEKERKILETKIETYIFEFDLFAAEEILLEAIVGSSAKLDSLKNSLGNIKSTKVIKPVTITYQSARPKLLLNIVLAGLIGLFSGIFIVFGKRWWKSEI